MIALGVAAAVVLVCAAWAFHQSRTGLLIERRRRRAIVTLKSGEAFEGLVYETDRECLVLREASALAYGPKQENVIVEGEVLILRADIAYLQIP